jgi:hypothetical protein
MITSYNCNVIFTRLPNDPIDTCDAVVHDAWGNIVECKCTQCKGTLRDTNKNVILCAREQCVGTVRVEAKIVRIAERLGLSD